MSHEAKITIVRRPTGWLVRVQAPNGEILSTSELLTSRGNAVKNVIAQREVWNLHLFGEIRTQFRDERRAKRPRAVRDNKRLFGSRAGYVTAWPSKGRK